MKKFSTLAIAVTLFVLFFSGHARADSGFGYIVLKSPVTNDVVEALKNLTHTVEMNYQKRINVRLVDFLAFENRLGAEAYIFIERLDRSLPELKDITTGKSFPIHVIDGELELEVVCYFRNDLSFQISSKAVQVNFNWAPDIFRLNKRYQLFSPGMPQTDFMESRFPEISRESLQRYEVTLYDNPRSGSNRKPIIERSYRYEMQL